MSDTDVITATKSGTEKNAPVFARYWIDSLHDPAADADKNGTVSALEAFTYAQRKTAAYFESEKLLATEHAMIADDGRSAGVRTISNGDREAVLAAAFPLIRPATAVARNASPEKQKLVARSPSYGFRELLALRTVLRLREHRVPPLQIRRAIVDERNGRPLY